PGVFPYAYNIPRPRFDEALLARAVASGARHVITRAELDRGSPGGPGPDLRLTAGTLAAAPWLEGAQPHPLAHASGRARRGARALGIAARVGPRRDVAHFAHFQGVRWEAEAGQVLIARGHAGWSWRIPLQDRVSVGIVLGPDDAARLGQSPEARLEAAIASDPWLAPAVGAAARVSEVATYANYQLISERGHGPGWVMVGDAFGFVDPMLSPGVFLALRSAEMVCDGLAPALAGAGRAPDDL